MAGGFMSGFGNAFSRAWEAEGDRIERRKADTFQYMYKEYLDRRKKIEEEDALNKKNIQKAKSYAATYTQNEGNWPAIYQMLAAGRDDSEIIDTLKTKDLEITTSPTEDGSGPAAPNQDLTGQASSRMEAQMSQSGMQPPQGGVFGQLGEVFNPAARMRRDQEQAMGRISEVTGQSPDQIKKTLEGGTTPEQIPGMEGFKVSWKDKPKIHEAPDPWKVTSVEEAIMYQEWAALKGTPEDQALANRLYEKLMAQDLIKMKRKSELEGTAFKPRGAVLRDENGNFVRSLRNAYDAKGEEYWLDPVTGREAEGIVVPYDKELQKDLDEKASKLAKPVEEYNLSVSNFKQSLRTGTDIITLANNTPAATDWSGQLASVVSRVNRNAVNIVKLLTDKEMNENDGIITNNATPQRIEALAKVEQDLEASLKSGILSRMDAVAIQAALLDAKATKFAYMYAASLGQSGRSVTNEEFKNFKAIVTGTGNPDAIRQSISDHLKEMYAGTKDQESNINQFNGDIIAFEEKYNMPFPFSPAQNIDEAINSDPILKRSFEDLTANNPTLNSLPQATIEIPSELKGKLSPEEAELWDTMPDRGKELLKKKYLGAQ